jgi:hypothetical protein
MRLTLYADQKERFVVPKPESMHRLPPQNDFKQRRH